MRLYGVRGWGSAIAEGLLALAGQGYDFIDVEGFDRPGPARDRLAAVNPLVQVPALVLDDGTVMTETAAIALHLSDRAPGLAPAVGTPERDRFHRLLIWLVANVYPTFTYGDYPERWAPSAAQELVASTDRYRETLFRWLEEQVAEPFVLGDAPCALDIYVATMVAWRPHTPWFEQNTPKLMRIAQRTRQMPSVTAVMAANSKA